MHSLVFFVASGHLLNMRKPLYPIEKDAQPITVCVTGGTGIATDTQTALACCVQSPLYPIARPGSLPCFSCQCSRSCRQQCNICDSSCAAKPDVPHAGYIAGAIIARLLTAGHTVHATVRDPSNEEKLRWLKGLPQAATHLKFFKVMPCLRSHPLCF